MTAPPAWRAISPVSSVTVWEPHWKVLLTLLKMLIYLSWCSAWSALLSSAHRLRREPGEAVSNTMPFHQEPRGAAGGMTQRVFVLPSPKYKTPELAFD
jgi:hypothetical protein